MKKLLVFFVFFSSLFSALIDPDAQITIEQEESIGGCVNILNGSFYRVKEDLVVRAVEPIVLKRFYHSSDSLAYNGGLEFFPHLILYIDQAAAFAQMKEPSGISVRYMKNPKYAKKHKGEIFMIADLVEKLFEPRISEGLLSGRVNYRNNRIQIENIEKIGKTEARLFCADGTKRYYRPVNKKKIYDRDLIDQEGYRFLLYKEIKPNGNVVLYSYDNQERLLHVETRNPSENQTYAYIHFHYLGADGRKERNFYVTTSDGQKRNYWFWNPPDKHLTHNRHYFKKLESTLDKENWYYDEGYSNKYEDKEKKKHRFFDQARGPLVNRLEFPEGRELQVDYYQPENKVLKASDSICGRVKALKQPVGPNGSLVRTYEIDYVLGKFDVSKGAFKKDKCACRVRESDGNQIFFNFSGDLYLQWIDYLNGSKFHHKTEFFWNEHKNLTCKRYIDKRQELLFERNFVYDGMRGNVLEEKLVGNLTGRNTYDAYKTQYTYNESHLPISKEDENHLKITYEYLVGTDLILKKFVYDKNKLLLRNFFVYDEDHICIKEITDDGGSLDIEDLTDVTERRIKSVFPKKSFPAYNFPETIEERALDLKTKEEVLLKKIKYTYSSKAEVIKEEVFDSVGKFRYVIITEYNKEGLITKKSDPLGRTSAFNYNLNEELKEEKPFGAKYKIKKNYDRGGRVVLEEKISQKGLKHDFSYSYDCKNNLLAKTDQFGNQIEYAYDGYGNLLETKYPKAVFCTNTTKAIRSTERAEYDSFGRKTKDIDANGNVKKITYNVYGKPILILYPDGTKEQFHYYKNGLLEEEIDQEGTITYHIYDVLGRETVTHVHSSRGELVKEEIHTYNALHELSFKDAEGNITFYSYDLAGRKIGEDNGKEKTSYTYDSLGRLHKEIKHNEENSLIAVYERDLLDRVIEERKEDLTGRLLSKITYRYDSSGNRVETIHFVQGKKRKEKFFFDDFNRLIKTLDPLGYFETIAYNENFKNAFGQRVLKKTTTDPVGLKTLETFDSLNRLVAFEKRKSKTLLLHEKFYDKNGNFTELVNHVFMPNGSLKKVFLQKEYDVLNRSVSQIEDAESSSPKTTRYIYTKKGFLEKTVKPDGTVLENSYDILGNLVLLSSSDGSINYSYVYNKLGDLLELRDLNTDLAIQREVDCKGRVLKERLPHGLSLENTYDSLGRRTSLTILDYLYVDYSYDPLYLRKIERKDEHGSTLYEHKFLEYDLSGNLLKEQIFSGALISYDIDPLSRRKAFQMKNFSQSIDKYAPDGKVLKVATKIQAQKDFSEYAYDDLKQLVSEKGLFDNSYAYDSNYNRCSKNNHACALNNLDQLIAFEDSEYEYDPNGNPLLKISKTTPEELHYVYDALDRLTSLEKENAYRLEFSYDGLHRRMTQKTYLFQDSRWKLDQHFIFLYDGQNEIGAIDLKKNVSQLRILGDTEEAEIGSAVALEFDHKVCLPLHDLFGNVLALIDSQTNEPLEVYRYSAFGEERLFNFDQELKEVFSSSSFKNPWRFSSKRKDEISGLIYFGRRYYDSATGRFFTADPEGYTDSYNLYAYVFNDPLLGMDLYGLEFAENLKQGSIGLMHSAGNFGMDAFRLGVDLTFTMGMPLSLGWHLMTGKGSLSEEWQDHLKWQSRFNFKAQDLMQRVLPGDMNSSWYQGSKWGGGIALEAGVLAATAGSLVYKLGVKGVEFGAWGIQRALMGRSFAFGRQISTAEDVLSVVKPRGRYIGQLGSTSKIRELSGGGKSAEKMFNSLIKNARETIPRSYHGTMYKLSDGTRIGYRSTSTFGPPSIDIHIPNQKTPIKLKFKE